MPWAARIFLRTNEWIAIATKRILSWPIWIPGLLIGSGGGLIFHQDGLIMMLLTIQTSLDAAATNILQAHIREADAKREAMLKEQIDLLVEMMQNAERRDLLAAKRDRAILTALEARNDLLEFLQGKGEFSHGCSRTTNARKNRASAIGHGPALRRRNRGKS